jgi:hypothetical protein
MNDEPKEPCSHTSNIKIENVASFKKLIKNVEK